MLLRGGHGEEAKMTWLQGVLDPLQQGDVVKHRGHQHHGRAAEQIGPAVLEAGELGARHGMPAHKGKAVFPGNGKAPGADFLLHTAAVQHKGVFGNQMGILFQPGGAAIGIDCQQDQVTFGYGFLVELAMYRPGQHGKGQHGFVSLNRVDGVSLQRIGPGQGAADETKPQNSYIHTRTSRILCTFRFSSSNWGGVRD